MSEATNEAASGRNTLSLTGHLGELRSRLIFIGVTFLIAAATAFLYVQDIYSYLSRDFDQRLVILGPSDALWVYMMIAGIIGAAITLPVAAYQIWRYVSPALSPTETKAALSYIPTVFLLFIIGIGFGYLIVFPFVLEFLQQMALEQFTVMFTAEKYFLFMVNMILPFGLLFEMPAAVMFLTRLGILNPARLRKVRKLAYFILVVTSVVITPPDFISDFLVTVPLLILYEISVTLSGIVYRRNIKSSCS
jgi:sec-independent protein translocase protein TatC